MIKENLKIEILIGKEMNNLKNKYKFEYNLEAPYRKKMYKIIVESLFLTLSLTYYDFKFGEKLKI